MRRACECSRPLQDAFFERSDLLHGGIEEIEFLFKTATGFSRKFLEGSIEPGSAFIDEDIAVIRVVESVLSEGGVNAVLESGTRLRECHTGSVKFSFVADLTWWQSTAGRLPRWTSVARSFASSLSVI